MIVPSPPVQFQQLVVSMPKFIEALPAVCGGPTPDSYLFSAKAVKVLVWNQCLLWNQIFVFQKSRNLPKARKTGSTVAQILCWSRTKNRLRHF